MFSFARFFFLLLEFNPQNIITLNETIERALDHLIKYLT